MTAESCVTYDTLSRTQEVVAPFVLENLGCSGDEARLMDCPVFDSDIATPTIAYENDDYLRDYSNSATCDPFLARGGTYARVACGTSSSAGLYRICCVRTALLRIPVDTMSMPLECLVYHGVHGGGGDDSRGRRLPRRLRPQQLPHAVQLSCTTCPAYHRVFGQHLPTS